MNPAAHGTLPTAIAANAMPQKPDSIAFTGDFTRSDPAATLGDAQLARLADDLAKQPADACIVVFARRPLFDLDVCGIFCGRGHGDMSGTLIVS